MPPVRRFRFLFLLLLVSLPGLAIAQRHPVAKPTVRPAPSQGRTRASRRLTALQWADSVRTTIDHATRLGGMPRLEAARRVVARALAAYPDDALLLHYEGLLLYRMVSANGTTLTPEVTAAYLDDARAALERSIARRPMAESYGLVSEIYSRQIAENPARGASLAPNMALARARMLAIGAKNPRVYLLAGIAALHSSADAGGGVKAAERLLKESVDLFAHDHPRRLDPSWGHAEAYAWLGQVYKRTGRDAAAAALFAKALTLEPDNAWVRDVLVPGMR
jgi:tetratricopeptide (TPR) repeat protein